ncbi:Limulus clotting factor C [Harpegnathos saltator]|uniref:Limulus clotting factor C n=2 Tax=Harpegnathos saltator TaxID=610380 RepID=E2BCT4_HARSA|nr:Limulus clotting factor C [Harpegnathos saltator]
MNARAVLSISLSLLALLPSPSVQDNAWYDSLYKAPGQLVEAVNSASGIATSLNLGTSLGGSKWGAGAGISFAGSQSHSKPGNNKNGRGPPGGLPPGLSNGGPPGLNGNLPPGWNKGNNERPAENGPYTDTSTEKFTDESFANNNNNGPRGPDNRVPNQDERPQVNGQCRNDQFRCGSNECLPLSVKCDDKIDCRDSSDEASCITNRNNEENALPGSCVLPEQPLGGRYKLGGCEEQCQKHPGDTVPKNSILTYSCKDNYVLKGNNISVCVDSEWYALPSCRKICPTLSSTSVDISCSYQGEKVSCSERVLPGTRAKLSCKSSYKLPLTNDPAYREITCLDDGLWDRPVFRCLPECGTSIAHGNTLIVNGFEAKVGVFPWHVGIYRKNANMKHEQICGGSLVSNNLVVSAAHCFYDEAFGKLHDASNYAVAAGKHYRAWDVNEQYTQKSLVESVKLGSRFLGARGNFAEDIALVKLKTPLELSTLVQPICMDWENVYEWEQLRMGQSGKVVGWGRNINGESTQTLFEVDMPFVPYSECLSAVPVDFRGYLTSDKFCAGRLNGSSVCEGDSGGGLCFQKDGVWYLRGVVSVSPVRDGHCDYNSYVGFTSISHFRDWIREAYVSA